MRSLETQAEHGPFRAPPGNAGGGQAHTAADRYSRRVVLLKRVLPVLGAALLLMVAAWSRLSPVLDSVRFAFPAIDLREARELKMLDLRYAGIDRFNRPYVVTAAVGRQVPDHDDLMSLERPRGVMAVHGGAKIVLTAATGIYQSQTKLLDLFGHVTLTHQDGTRFVTARAHANFSDNTAKGDKPIEGHGPSGDIWGQGFRILDNGDTIIFSGRSHLVLKGVKPGATAAPPPALPATITKTAARIDAALPLPRAAASRAQRPAAVVRSRRVSGHHSTERSHRARRRTATRPAADSRVARRPIARQPAGREAERHAGGS